MQGDVTAERGPEAIDSEQILILEESIDDNDADGDGFINESELEKVLTDLGVEPTKDDVKTIYDELAHQDTGLISKDRILQASITYARRYDAEGPMENPQTLKEMAIASMDRIDSQRESGALENQGSDASDAMNDLGTVESIDLKTSSEGEIQPDTNGNSKLKSVESQLHISHPSNEPKGILKLFKRKTKLRDTPGTFTQFFILLMREGTKWTRSWLAKFMDIILLVLAAVTCGAIHGTGGGPNDVRGNSALVLLTVGILSCTTSLATFGRIRLSSGGEGFRTASVTIFPVQLIHQPH
eukprot:jgi/Picre1/35365/NNA_002827.t1